MRLAISRDSKNFDEPQIAPTPKDFASGMTLFKKIMNELAGGERIQAVAGGIAGPLDREKTKLVHSPNISGWINKPLKKTLQKVTDAPVFLENDAAIVGLGEAVFGAGRGEKIVTYVTVSTGVGGTRIVDGKIDQNTHGFEPGHQIIDPVGTLCSVCGAPGYLEGYVSGTALEHRYHKKPHEITDPEVWEQEAKWLAYGLNKMYDVAAVKLIIEEAGGIFEEELVGETREDFLRELLETKDPKYLKGCGFRVITSGNQNIHDKIKNILLNIS